MRLKNLLLSGLLVLSCGLSAGAQQELEKFQPVEGVKLGQIKYFPAALSRDENLETALRKAFDIGSKEEVRYLYNRVKLTPQGDHILVMLPGPAFSGSGGSSAAVFERLGPNYRLVTRFTVMQNPVLVAQTSSRGWHDLVVRASGGGMPAKFVRLRFDGSRYPSNPTTAKDADLSGSTIKGTAYLATPLGPDAGLTFTTP